MDQYWKDVVPCMPYGHLGILMNVLPLSYTLASAAQPFPYRMALAQSCCPNNSLIINRCPVASCSCGSLGWCGTCSDFWNFFDLCFQMHTSLTISLYSFCFVGIPYSLWAIFIWLSGTVSIHLNNFYYVKGFYIITEFFLVSILIQSSIYFFIIPFYFLKSLQICFIHLNWKKESAKFLQRLFYFQGTWVIPQGHKLLILWKDI